MPRTKLTDLDTSSWTDSDWMEFGPAFEPLPEGITEQAADAIYDFKGDDAFLGPLDTLASEIEVTFRSSFPEFEIVNEWFSKQLANGTTQEELDHIYALYVGQVVMTEFQRMGVGWTLDPRPEEPTYLKPVVGPFPTGKPMKYLNPFEYVVADWIGNLPLNTYNAMRQAEGWVSDGIEQMSSSPVETHFFRKMNGMLPEF